MTQVMTEDEAKEICREFYRHEGGDSEHHDVDGLITVIVSARQWPGQLGVGLHKTSATIARALAWKQLKYKMANVPPSIPQTPVRGLSQDDVELLEWCDAQAEGQHKGSAAALKLLKGYNQALGKAWGAGYVEGLRTP